mmetsp:Transcript_128587/g.256846  ORF Transcript_128587/g.256846 Transcript_128587/m.256846 type:complete len:243 (-) Transcript_128587:748-1476(-)
MARPSAMRWVLGHCHQKRCAGPLLNKCPHSWLLKRVCLRPLKLMSPCRLMRAEDCQRKSGAAFVMVWLWARKPMMNTLLASWMTALEVAMGSLVLGAQGALQVQMVISMRIVQETTKAMASRAKARTSVLEAKVKARARVNTQARVAQMLRKLLLMASMMILEKGKATGSTRARRVKEKVKARVLERREMPVLHLMLVTFLTNCRPDSHRRTKQMRQSSQRGQKPLKHRSMISATCGSKSKR